MRAWKKHPCQEGPWDLTHPGGKHQMRLRWGRLGCTCSTCSLSGLHLSITISSASNTLPSYLHWASSYFTFRTQLNVTSSKKQPLTTHSCSCTSSCPWAFGLHSYRTKCSMTCLYTPLPHKKKKNRKKNVPQNSISNWNVFGTQQRFTAWANRVKM